MLVWQDNGPVAKIIAINFSTKARFPKVCMMLCWPCVQFWWMWWTCHGCVQDTCNCFGLYWRGTIDLPKTLDFFLKLFLWDLLNSAAQCYSLHFALHISFDDLVRMSRLQQSWKDGAGKLCFTEVHTLHDCYIYGHEDAHEVFSNMIIT